MRTNECSIPGIPKTAEPKRVGTVEAAARDIEATACRIVKATETLAARLTPLLRPCTEECASPAAPDYNAPFAQVIQSTDRTLYRAEDAIRDLLDRLEI